MHKLARRQKQKLLENMIAKGTSLRNETRTVLSAEKLELYRGRHDTFKTGLKAKIEKRKAANLKKINKIKIKTKKI